MTIWRAVPEWVGYYEVSDEGQVRSVSRTLTNSAGRTVRIKGRILRTSVTPKGYHIVTFTRPGVRKSYPVHRLVAEAFIGPLPEGWHTCHGDGNKDNNAVTNLRYDTASANELDKVAQGLNRNAAKTECPQGHPYSAENTRIHRSGGRSCRTCHRERRKAERDAERLARLAENWQAAS